MLISGAITSAASLTLELLLFECMIFQLFLLRDTPAGQAVGNCISREDFMLAYFAIALRSLRGQVPE